MQRTFTTLEYHQYIETPTNFYKQHLYKLFNYFQNAKLPETTSNNHIYTPRSPNSPKTPTKMAPSPLSLLLLIPLHLLVTPTNSLIPSSANSLCNSTPYPSSCLNSLKLSISINIPPFSLLSAVLHSLTAAISEATSLTPILSSAQLTEHQHGAVQDCRDLHQITVSSLEKSSQLVQSLSGNADGKGKLGDVKAHLSAALTNKNTCLEGLATATGPGKDAVVGSWLSAYGYVSNSLSLVSRPGLGMSRGRRLLSKRLFPVWIKRKDRRLLQSGDYDGYDPASILTVAQDGSGNFTTISDAIAFAPNMSDDRTFVIVRAGLYEENVVIPGYKTNIVMLGDGSDVTVISGNRSVGDGWTTFRSATVAVSGQGFLARDLAFENTAGPAMGQAVALRINADLSAIFRCVIDGYQDTLYVHSFRQFYRDCDISGTIDFIFGNAAVIFQNCNIYAKLPKPGQANVITAQSRDDPNEATGISIQNCSIVASDDLAASNGLTKTYLGRPWRNYSTTVYIESYIDGIVDPSGWTKWSDDDNEALDTLYYGEYMNDGAGAGTDGRVTWPGFHLMDYDEAYNFTVSQFIYGDQWLDSTSFPYDDGI